MDSQVKVIKNMFDEYLENYNYLMSNQQISFAQDYKSQFSKMLLISTASYFETRISVLIKEIFGADKCILLMSFLEKKALSRQYHTLFNWRSGAAGIRQFFGYLGKEFAQYMLELEKKDEQLAESFSNFMQIGAKRNALVHDNYAIFSLDWTPEEIMNKFDSALFFTDNLLEIVYDYRNAGE